MVLTFTHSIMRLENEYCWWSQYNFYQITTMHDRPSVTLTSPAHNNCVHQHLAIFSHL